MQATVRNFLVARLYEWGVRHIFDYLDDGINSMFGALQRTGDKIEFVQVRREEMAAFMTSAHAEFTGEFSVCMAASGPGAAYLITSLYDARLDHMPVLAVTGQQTRTTVGGHYQQEVDLVAMSRDVAGAFVHQASMPAQVRYLLDHAVRIAIGQRRVMALVLLNDLQETPHTESPRVHSTMHSGVGYNALNVILQAVDLKRAVDILNSGRWVAMSVGVGALGASMEVVAVAGTLGAGMVKALLGKAVLLGDLLYVTGAIGLFGTEPSWELMNHYDTLLMVGPGFPHAEFLSKEGQARGAQIDLDPDTSELRCSMGVSLVGDSTRTLRTLLPPFQCKIGPYQPNRIARWNESWWKALEDRALQPVYPINPQHMLWELSPKLPDDVIVTSDSGTCANQYARDLKLKPGMMGSLLDGLASMGVAVPYTIAVKFAHPERPVIALVGDGVIQMNNMAELITVSKYWKRWESPKWIYMVLNNQDLNEAIWE